jgi:hypothetical protein
MTQRLQVLFDDDELDEIRAQASRERMTVAEWVRQSLRAARGAAAAPDPVARIFAVREAAARYDFPVSDVASMNADIARGYTDEESSQS